MLQKYVIFLSYAKSNASVFLFLRFLFHKNKNFLYEMYLLVAFLQLFATVILIVFVVR